MQSNAKKKTILAVFLLSLASICFAANKYIYSSGNLTLGTASNYYVNLQNILYTTQTGYVGIGTSIPTSLLQTNDTTAQTTTYTGVLHNVTATSSTSSINKVGMDIESTGSWSGTSAVNTGLVVNATGGTTNYAATFNGGNVGIGTSSPGYSLDVNGTVRTTQVKFQPSSCATGFVLVPADNKFTFRDFCVMKYHAGQNATTTLPESVAADLPWVSITAILAYSMCSEIGTHLITPYEWMTIARNIEATPINNLDGSSPIHLATGHSDSSPSTALAATTDPSMTNCNVNYALSDSHNSSCALKAASSGTGSYYGEGAGNYYTGTYSAGATGMAQMRTHVLSNGNIIWDMAGNVDSWVDLTCTGGAGSGIGVWYNGAAYIDWNNANLTDWEKLVAGPAGSEISTGGTGQYYGCTANGNQLLRGGDWSLGVRAGVFYASLNGAPSYSDPYIGFRCAYAP